MLINWDLILEYRRLASNQDTIRSCTLSLQTVVIKRKRQDKKEEKKKKKKKDTKSKKSKKDKEKEGSDAETSLAGLLGKYSSDDSE